MKKLIITTIIALLTVAGITARAEEWPQEYLGLPGDNLNLFAVMKLFQESETLESFERNLNNENTRINNLDLNGDNMVDYIMIFDYVDGNVHNIVLRVALNRHENQDVAIFTVEQHRDGIVEIQLIGDEALYGRNYIIEPAYAETPNPGYRGAIGVNPRVVVVNRMIYAVEAWPLIRYIYLPGYATWRSDWYWGYQPHYWDPWHPYYWHFYYGYHYNWHSHYYNHYRHWDHYRYARYNDFYHSRIRIYSPTIIVNINSGHYKKTYSRPELRSKGSELYAMTNNTREKAAVERSARKTESSTVKSRTTEEVNSTNTRRSTTVTDKRATTNATVAKEAENTGRRTTVTRKAEPATERVTQSRTSTARSTNNTEVKTNVTTRRTPATVTKKTTTVPTARQSTGSVQRPSTTVTRREAPAPRTSSVPTVSRPTISRSKSAATSGGSVSRPTTTARRSSEPANNPTGRTARR
jgi:hypothetical protein